MLHSLKLGCSENDGLRTWLRQCPEDAEWRFSAIHVCWLWNRSRVNRCLQADEQRRYYSPFIDRSRLMQLAYPFATMPVVKHRDRSLKLQALQACRLLAHEIILTCPKFAFNVNPRWVRAKGWLWFIVLPNSSPLQGLRKNVVWFSLLLAYSPLSPGCLFPHPFSRLGTVPPRALVSLSPTRPFGTPLSVLLSKVCHCLCGCDFFWRIIYDLGYFP